MGFPCGSAGKESSCNVGDLGSIPGLGRSPGEGKLYPLQYSGLENSMNCTIHGVTKSQTQLRDFQFTSLHSAWGHSVRLDWVTEHTHRHTLMHTHSVCAGPSRCTGVSETPMLTSSFFSSGECRK